MKILLQLLKNGIVSDGDWDGVVGTGLLLRYSREHRVSPSSVLFPNPKTFANLHIDRKVCIEIIPTKCYIEHSLIFDHHEGPQTDKYQGNIWIFGKSESVAELISKVLEVSIPEQWMTAVNEVDTARINSKLGELLFKAYHADVANFPREHIAKLIADENYSEIMFILKQKAREFKKQEERAKLLMEDATELVEGVISFEYFPGDEGAKRIALIALEEKYPVVLAYSVTPNGFVSSIATRSKQINLIPLFDLLRKNGFSAGGHENVGGIQGNSLRKFLNLLKDYFTTNKPR